METKNAAQIADGIVTNITVWAGDSEVPHPWVPCEKSVAIGWGYDGADFSPPEPAPPAPLSAEEQAVRARFWRNRELVRADYAIFLAEDIGADPSPWRSYRIALRDWPETAGFPETKPEAPGGII